MHKNVIIALIAVLVIGLGAWLFVGGLDEVENENNEEQTTSTSSETDEADREGTIELSFLGETYNFADANCRSHRTFPPENEMIRYRNADANLEFWVERIDPDQSDAVEVHLAFPTGDSGETIGEVEAYDGYTTMDVVTFEIGEGTQGSLQLEPHINMNDDVDHEESGGLVEWNISC